MRLISLQNQHFVITEHITLIFNKTGTLVPKRLHKSKEIY